MYCKRCGTKNHQASNFCAGCGESLKRTKAPTWMWSFIIILVVAIGGIYYYIFESLSGEKATSTLTNNVNEAIQAVTTSNVDPTDRVALIKHIQQSVFTVVTENGHGSGFLYAKGGYIVTNAHVVQGVVDVAIRNTNGQEVDATVIGISDSYDIALLHAPAYAKQEPLPIETSESPVGLEVIAFGSPQGFENTASTGYITGHNRDFENEGFIYSQVYQVDAQIDKGSSGGALVDATTGKVIGINSLLYTSETSTNFGFSIPLYSMMDYFDDWIAEPMSAEMVVKASGVYEDYTYYEEEATDYYDDDQSSYIETDEALAGQYVQSFRMYYEQALNDSNFGWVSDMLTGVAYNEMEDYIADIAYNGHIFEFLSNDVLRVTYDNGVYYVETNETFNFYPSSGANEYFDRYKTYTVIVDEYGSFKISNITIHN